MVSRLLRFDSRHPWVVGSVGSLEALRALTPEIAMAECNVVEIRLDVLARDQALHPEQWSHLQGIPLLFTARCQEEGGVLASTCAERISWVETCLADASAIDIEAHHLAAMAPAVQAILDAGIPLVASFHDFEKTPETAVWQARLDSAKAAGATVFKAAASIHTPADLARLAEFQAEAHGIAVAMMGMGPLAPVSRLLCAQYGSVLNYGFLGNTPTAPGQWSAARLKEAIESLQPVLKAD